MRLGTRMSLCAAAWLTAGACFAQSGIGPITHSVPNARQHVGNPATVISAGFSLRNVVQGTDPLENPNGVITNFGLLSDGTLTEPDENTYLVFASNPGGPTPGYDYGRHFIFQVNENGGGKA